MFCILAQERPPRYYCRGDKMSRTSSDVKNRWNAKNYDRLNIMLPKGYKEKLREIVGPDGSITAFIKDAIDEKMKDGQA